MTEQVPKRKKAKHFDNLDILSFDTSTQIHFEILVLNQALTRAYQKVKPNSVKAKYVKQLQHLLNKIGRRFKFIFQGTPKSQRQLRKILRRRLKDAKTLVYLIENEGDFEKSQTYNIIEQSKTFDLDSNKNRCPDNQTALNRSSATAKTTDNNDLDRQSPKRRQLKSRSSKKRSIDPIKIDQPLPTARHRQEWAEKDLRHARKADQNQICDLSVELNLRLRLNLPTSS